MKKFAFGLVAGWVLNNHADPIRWKLIKFLDHTIAKLELHQDILKHDNPEIS